jgi:hypothetical protein
LASVSRQTALDDAVERIQFAYPQIYHAFHTRHARRRSTAAHVSMRDGAILGDRPLGETDSRLIVWDEVVGYLVGVACRRFSWQTVVLSFAIERAIDISKVPPSRWIERRFHNGFGDVADDVIAGAYCRLILYLLIQAGLLAA